MKEKLTFLKQGFKRKYPKKSGYGVCCRVIAAMLSAVMILSTMFGNIAFAGDQNLIVNGSFDSTEGLLTGWSTSGDVTVSKSDGSHAVVCGEKEMAILQSTSGAAEAEEWYQLSFSIKATDKAIFKATILQYNGYAQSAAGDLIVPLTKDIHSDKWEKVDYIFRAAADVTALAVSFDTILGTALVDDVSMRCLYRDVKYNPEGDEVKIENASFYQKLKGWSVVDGKGESINKGYYGKAVAVSTIDGIGRLTQDNISLESDSLYELHYYIKATDAADFESSVVIEVLDDGELRRIRPCLLEGNSVAGGWQEMTAQFVTGTISGKATVELLVQSTDVQRKKATVAFDELMLTKLVYNRSLSMMSLNRNTEVNLVQNGNFTEGEDGLEGWTVNWYGANAEGSMHEVIDDPEYGKVLHIKKSKNDTNVTDAYMTITEPMVVGKAYTISVKMKNTGTMNRDTDGSTLFYLRGTSGGADWANLVIGADGLAGGWKEYTYQYTPEKEIENQVAFIRTIGNSSSQLDYTDFYYADVKITPVTLTETIGENLVQNGNFTEGEDGLEGWTVNWYGANAEGSMHEVIDDPEYGKVLHIKKSKNDTNVTDAYMTITEPMVVGKTYTISVKMKNTGAMNRDTDGSTLFYLRGTAGGADWANLVIGADGLAGGWKEYTYQYTPEKEIENQVAFIRTIGNSSSQLDYTDFYYADVKITTVKQWITNGTFTNGVNGWSNVNAENVKDGATVGAASGNALQITKPAGDNLLVTNVPMDKTAKAGEKYTFKYRVRNNALLNDADDIGSVYFKDAEGNKIAKTEKKIYPSNGVWSDVVIDYVAEQDYTGLVLCLDMTGEAAITYTFADFSFGEYKAIVSNGDFAEGIFGWDVRWNGGETKPADSKSSVEVVDDADYTKALKLRKYKDDSSLTDIYMTLGENLAVGQIYKFSAKIKNSVAENQSGAQLLLYKRIAGSAVGLMGISEGTDDEWKEYSVEFAVEEGEESPQLQFRGMVETGAEGEYIDYYLADVKLERTGKTSTTMLRNGSFSYVVNSYPSFWGVIGEGLNVTNGVANVSKSTNQGAGMTTLLHVYEDVTHQLQFDIKADKNAREMLKLRLTPYRDGLRKPASTAEVTYLELDLQNTDNWQTVTVPFEVVKGVVSMDMSLYCEGEKEAEFSVDNVFIGFDEETQLNFDFEVGRDTPMSWSSSAGVLERVQESYNGAQGYSAKISNSTGGSLSSQKFALAADADYELSYWVKADQSFDSVVYAIINQQKENGDPAYSWTYGPSEENNYRAETVTLAPSYYNYTYGSTLSTENPEGWQQVRFSFHTSAEAEQGILHFLFGGEGEAIWIDHIQLTKKEQSDLKNLDFEKANAEGNPEGWYLGGVRDANPKLQIVDDVYHSGSHSLYINTNTLGASLLTSTYLIPLNTVGNRAVYEMSFWMASRNADVKSIQMELWYYAEDGVKLFTSSVGPETPSLQGVRKTLNSGTEISEWSQTITRSTVPGEAKYVALVFSCTPGSAEIWLDDLRFAQVEADEDVIAAYSDFHAKDHNGNIGEWDVVDDEMQPVSGKLSQVADDNEGFYGNLNTTVNQYMRYRTNTMATGYTYQLLVRYKSDYDVDLQIRFNNYQDKEYGEQRVTKKLSPCIDWREEIIEFVAPSVTTSDIMLGLTREGELKVSKIVLFQTETPKNKAVWQGQWLSYKMEILKCQTYSHSYYREEVELNSEVIYAPFQFTADDCMILYVNGKEVFNNVNDNLQTWANTQYLDLTEYLHKGKNVIAFDVYNQSAYSGVLYDGIWTCKDESKVEVLSEATTKVFSEEYDGKVPEGWMSVDFDDSGWKNAVSIGYVGVSPWGSLFYDGSLYIENVIEIKTTEGEDALVNDLEYEFSIDIKSKNEITEQVPITMVLWKKHSTESICKLTPTLLTNKDMRKWPAGEWINVKMKVQLPDYIDSGSYTLQLDDTYFVISNEDLFDGRFINFDVLNNYKPSSLEAKVENVNGVPTFTVNGTPQPGFWFGPPPFNQNLALETIADSGIETYKTFFAIGNEKGPGGIWAETGAINFAEMDQNINTTLSASDEAYLIVAIDVYAPQWWKDKNPNELVKVADLDGTIHYPDGEQYVSFGSTKWKEEAADILEKVIAHMKQQKYWSRIAGFQLSSGRTAEFMTYLDSNGMSAPDYSTVAQDYFRKWAQKKYGSIERLREVWKEPNLASFEDIELPTFAELKAGGEYGMLLDPATQQKEIDSRLVLDEMAADNLLYWAETVKNATNNSVLVGSYYGYLTSGCAWETINSAHSSTQRVLESPYIDFIASPIAYSERQLGESQSAQTVADSVRAYGKLYINEQDNRTVMLGQFAGSSWDLSRVINVGNTYTMQDTIYQEKRDMIHNLVKGNGAWLYDMSGGWIADEQIYNFTRDCNDEYNFANYVNRSLISDVAIIVPDAISAYMRNSIASDGDGSIGNQTVLGMDMFRNHRKELYKMGTGYDTYALSTLEKGKMPEHKINVFCTPFVLSQAERQAIDKYCKNNGQINIFLYMSGYGDEDGYHLENMKELTGFEFGINNQRSSSQIVVTNPTSDITKGLVGEQFGMGISTARYSIREVFVQEDSDTVVLGKLNDSGNVGFAAKDMGDWTSIYCAAPLLSTEIYRNLLEMADIHVYSENNADIIWANSAYVGVHSAASGNKTIYLDGNYAVYDVYEEKYISMDTNVIEYYHKMNDTHLFRLMPPNTYSFLARIKGGNGTISVNGLEQLASGSNKKLVIEPDKGYVIKSVTVNGEEIEVPTDKTLNFNNIKENKVIVVKFKREPVFVEEDEVVDEDEVVVDEEDSNQSSGAINMGSNEESETNDTITGITEEEPYEEIWDTLQRFIKIPDFIVLASLVGLTGLIMLLVWLCRKLKEKREREEAGL